MSISELQLHRIRCLHPLAMCVVFTNSGAVTVLSLQLHRYGESGALFIQHHCSSVARTTTGLLLSQADIAKLRTSSQMEPFPEVCFCMC